MVNGKNSGIGFRMLGEGDQFVSHFALHSSQFTLHPFAAGARANFVPVGDPQMARAPESLYVRLENRKIYAAKIVCGER